MNTTKVWPPNIKRFSQVCTTDAWAIYRVIRGLTQYKRLKAVLYSSLEKKSSESSGSQMSILELLTSYDWGMFNNMT